MKQKFKFFCSQMGQQQVIKFAVCSSCEKYTLKDSLEFHRRIGFDCRSTEFVSSTSTRCNMLHTIIHITKSCPQNRNNDNADSLASVECAGVRSKQELSRRLRSKSSHSTLSNGIAIHKISNYDLLFFYRIIALRAFRRRTVVL